MTTDQAREYLRTAIRTEVGKDMLRQLGYGGIVDAPDDGDGDSSVFVAEQLKAGMLNAYGWWEL